jgi:hypothetical protein
MPLTGVYLFAVILTVFQPATIPALKYGANNGTEPHRERRSMVFPPGTVLQVR